MKHLLTIVFVLAGIWSSAQEKHFIFIQADNNQPFYVQLNGKLYSSSASGYVIIPKLLQGEYDMSVGFAQNAYPEQGFHITIDKKDLGFNLKNFGDKGWGLFDLQTYEVTMAGKVHTSEVAKITKPETKQVDEEPVISFDKAPKETVIPNQDLITRSTENLKKAPLVRSGIFNVSIVDDTKRTGGSSTAKVPVAMEYKTVNEPLKTSQVLSVEIVNQTSLTSSVPVVENVTGQVPAGEVKKVSETKNQEGVTISYIDKAANATDTIQVIIPETRSTSAVQKTSEIKSVTEPVIAMEKPSSENISQPKTNENKEPISFLTLTNTCKALASEEDFYKLRKKMLGQMSDEKMIGEAKKIYLQKCFTTSQVKALSVLFMSDEGRYRFFDASYDYVSDPERYPSLQSELIDVYFVNRFKAMLR